MTDAAPADAAAWSRVARTVIRTPYPWSPGHTVLGPDDGNLVLEELHPAFHGSLDWHSCVHMQWSLVILLTRYAAALGREERDAVVGLLAERLRPEHVDVEVAYLRERPSFERPYGWAWAAQLVAALTEAAGGRAAPHTPIAALADAVAPLGEVVLDLVLGWLPRQTYPVRHGKHQNDAFACGSSWTPPSGWAATTSRPRAGSGPSTGSAATWTRRRRGSRAAPTSSRRR